jgi:hypothetical protein
MYGFPYRFSLYDDVSISIFIYCLTVFLVVRYLLAESIACF